MPVPAPGAPAPAPAPAPVPAATAAPAPEPAVQVPPGSAAASSELITELMQCQRVGKAIRHAMTLEAFIPAPKVYFEGSDESDSETDSEADEEAEVATVRYKHALRRLDRAYPQLQFGTVRNPRDTTQVATAANSMRCECRAAGGRVNGPGCAAARDPWLL